MSGEGRVIDESEILQRRIDALRARVESADFKVRLLKMLKEEAETDAFYLRMDLGRLLAKVNQPGRKDAVWSVEITPGMPPKVYELHSYREEIIE